MQLTSLLSARTAADREETDEPSGDDGSGIRDRLTAELRSGRLAIATGLVWIVRGVRSSGGRGRRLALGVLALLVGLLQRRSRRDGSTLPEGDLTETIRGESGSADGTDESRMAEVELGGEGTAEPPEDMQTDMEASDELTDETGPDESGAGPGNDPTEETAAGDEHETDVGTAGEDEAGIDLGTDGEADEEAGGADESMAVETGEEGTETDDEGEAETDDEGEAETDDEGEAETDDGGEADDTPPDVAESFEDNESGDETA